MFCQAIIPCNYSKSHSLGDISSVSKNVLYPQTFWLLANLSNVSFGPLNSKSDHHLVHMCLPHRLNTTSSSWMFLDKYVNKFLHNRFEQ